MDQIEWLTTREVLERTKIHRRTLDTWQRRGHVPAPVLRDNLLFWHPSVPILCLTRVRLYSEQRSTQNEAKPKKRTKNRQKRAQRNTRQAIRWLAARVIASHGGRLPLAGVTIIINKQRLLQIEEKYKISYSEVEGQVLLRIVDKTWIEPKPPSGKP